jgi:hypothetical protein
MPVEVATRGNGAPSAEKPARPIFRPLRYPRPETSSALGGFYQLAGHLRRHEARILEGNDAARLVGSIVTASSQSGNSEVGAAPPGNSVGWTGQPGRSFYIKRGRLRQV